MRRWPEWANRLYQPRLVLAAGTAAFIVVAFGLDWLRSLELHPTAYDLGLYQQALWTGGHYGSFYEAPDWQSAGYATFFEVHLAPAMFLLAPLYTAFPSPLTLYAVQAAVLGLAALPLYGLARDVRGSSWDGAMAAGLYLVWAPLLAGALFDFHLEAFGPLELFGFLWVWRSRRRWLAAPIILAIAVSGEFTLPTLAAIGLYEAFRAGGWGEGGRYPRVTRLSSWLKQPGVWGALSVTVVATVCWATVALFQAHLGALLTSTPGSVPPGLSISGLSNAYSVAPANLVSEFPAKLTGWMLVYALVGFLPWWVPRSQIVAVPWILFSVFQPTAQFIVPGGQDAFLIAVPLFLGVAEGWPRCREWVGRQELGSRSTGGGVPEHRRAGLVKWTPVALGILVAFNLLLSPIDPLVQQSGDLGPGYGISYIFSGDFDDARAVAALLPVGATVLASTDLFPLVANDANAYVLPGPVSPGGFTHLPFGAANLPPAVLLAQDRLGDVPSWLVASLYNQTFYRICGVAWDSPIGAVMLFEGTWTAPCAALAPAYFGSLPPSDQRFQPSQLTPGAAGKYYSGGKVSGVAGISSIPGVGGNIWHGPYAALSPGAYEAIVSVHWYPWATSGSPSPAISVLELTVAAFGYSPWVHESIAMGVISPTTWGELVVPFVVPAPAMGVEVVGDQISLQGYITCTEVDLQRVG